jgi:hypothetical protein
VQLNYRDQLTSENISSPDRISATDLQSKLTLSQYTSSQRSNLTAQWIVENGKLVCRWIVS